MAVRQKKNGSVSPFPEEADEAAARVVPEGGTKVHGGRRDGAGRKPIGESKMKAYIFMRCSEEQRLAIEGYVEELNSKRKQAGLKPMKTSTWLREIALKYSGNSHLNEAALAAAAESML